MFMIVELTGVHCIILTILLVVSVLRDFDGYIYLREWSGGIIGGGFEPKGKPIFHNGVPDKFEFQLLQEDWDHFREYLREKMFTAH